MKRNKTDEGDGGDGADETGRRRRHLRVGWGAILLFSVLGLVLEGLHGFKVPWYMSIATEERRLVWTLAHAHGTLLGLLNIALAASLPLLGADRRRLEGVASGCMLGATLVLPAGFFLGGMFVRGGDPGPLVLLVPAGALLLIAALAVTVLRTWD
jgi:hypothetical protein